MNLARPDHLFVFCYDVEKDGARARLADMLGETLVRVQRSVFEGRMSSNEAKTLARRAALLLGPDDSLRVYCVSAAGLGQSLAVGPAPLPERGDFWLL